MLNKIKTIALLITLTFSLNSCLTTKTNVGNYQEQTGEEYKFAKGKQVWLFWGLLPMGRNSISTPTDGNCQVIGRNNFGDAIISFITLGIVTTRTIKIKAKRKAENSSSS